MADFGRIVFGPEPCGGGFAPQRFQPTPKIIANELVTPRSRARAVRESRTRLEGEQQRVRLVEESTAGILLTTVITLEAEWAVVLWDGWLYPVCVKLARLELL